MKSSKLNRNDLRQKFNALNLTKEQRQFYGVNGNSKNIVLKEFLDVYSPVKKEKSDYEIVREEARKLGYDEKQGRKKEDLLNFIKTKQREIITTSLKELQNNRIMKLITDGKYQEAFNIIFKDIIPLTEDQFNFLWNRIIADRYVISFTMGEPDRYFISGYDIINKKTIYELEYEGNKTTQYLPVNANTYEFFKLVFINAGELTTESIEQITKSDAILSIDFNIVSDVKIEKLKKPKRLLEKNADFFPYLNMTEMDLSRYQIYNRSQAIGLMATGYEDCIIHTLEVCGVEAHYLDRIKLSYVCGVHMSKKHLIKISEIIERQINLYTIDNSGKIRIQNIIPKKFNKVINICMYESHYFINEMIPYSKFFISNYNQLKDVKNAEQIIKITKGKYYERDNKASINTLTMVQILLKAGHFQVSELNMFDESVNHKLTRDVICLDNIENEQQLHAEEKNEDEDEQEGIKKKAVSHIFYADCESFVNIQPHRLFMLGVVGEKSDCVNIYKVNNETTPEDVVCRFLNRVISKTDIKDKKIVYFHNIKYDYHLLEPYLNMKSKVLKDNQLYSVSIIFYGHTIELRDSFKLIPQALSKFKKMFDLNDEYGKKEAIAYSYYTPENYGEVVDIKYYRTLLKDGDKKAFDNNMDTDASYNKKTKTFNPLDYYVEYLRLDCLCLKKGLQKFNDTIMEITGNLSIYDSLTISSLTDKYMKLNGGYDNVYEVCGNLREYISKAVYGGRVAVNEKYKKKVIEGKIADYDGVSLYPSAINRLCREIGLPSGKAKRLMGQDWKSFKYSILTVQIKNVNKNQQIPFIAHKGDGVINYLNKAPEKPIIIDSITLEDYIKFHKVEYEVLDGVYWEGIFNNKMGELIQNLFSTRLKYKKSKPALAETIKLMLNSSYGKTVMKKSKQKVNILKSNYKENLEIDDVFESYVYNNFRTIKSVRKLNIYNYEVEQICIDDSFNRGHIGCAILSMSKRIMNEVFDIANDNNFPIYYTDTDSLHCNFVDVKPLEDEYKKIYGKELNGKNLEQFHTDFDLDGAVEEIYATKSIFLGKKSYMDYLESKDENGNTINGYHKRLKGITEAGLNAEASKYENSFTGLYEDLANGNEVKILLNPKDKVLFEFKNGNVSTKGDFFRNVKF